MANERPILVTGACGFVGANVCRYFLEKGRRVVGLEGPSGLAWRLPEHPRLTLMQADICVDSAVSGLVDDLRPAAIVNSAAFGAYSSQMDATRIYEVNFNGTRNLLDAARRLGDLTAFVQLGSSSEYGIHCSGPKEDGPTWPDSDYAVSKVAASALVRFYAVKYAVPAFVMRLYSVYGPLEDASRLIPQLLLHARQSQLPPLTNAEISRDFVYIDDVSEALDAIIAAAPRLTAGDYFNVGTGVCTTLRSLVQVATRLFDIRQKPSWGSMAARHWDHAGWYADTTHTRERLGWTSRVPLADGLQRTMNWIEAHPDLAATAMSQSVLAAR